MLFRTWDFIQCDGRQQASIVGVIRSNLHLISPWKEAKGSRIDLCERSAQSGETIWWVRLG